MGFLDLFRTPAMDADLTMLTEKQATRLREVGARIVEDRLGPVTVHPRHLEGPRGERLELEPLAARLAELGAEGDDFLGVVMLHFTLLLDAMTTPRALEAEGPERALEHAVAGLYAPEDLPAGPTLAWREFAPGLVQVLALEQGADEPDHALNQESLDRLGGWDRVQEAAAASLRQVPEEQLKRDDDLPFTALVDFESETALRAVVGADVIEQVEGRRPGPAGYLFSIPDRGVFAWYTIGAADEAVEAAQQMVGWTIEGYQEGRNAMDPNLFWASEAGIQAVTEIEDGSVAFDPRHPAFETARHLEATGD